MGVGRTKYGFAQMPLPSWMQRSAANKSDKLIYVKLLDSGKQPKQFSMSFWVWLKSNQRMLSDRLAERLEKDKTLVASELRFVLSELFSKYKKSFYKRK